MVAVSGGERRQAEVAVVGREGITGLPLVLGVDRSPCEIFMQVEGDGQMISAEEFKLALKESDSILRQLLRYVHVFAVQGSYTALANAHGNIQERLARWLLMTQDRIQADELLLTHDFLALMLGVRRAGVTVALHALETKGLIETNRGSVTVHDRDGLEESANGLMVHPRPNSRGFSLHDEAQAQPESEKPMTERMTRYASALLIHAAMLTWILAPVPSLASWWIVRSSDEKCLVVDLEPLPGNKDVTRMGKDNYQTAQEAEADLKRLCPDSEFGR